jgi:ABC-type transport system involved in cytochrome c biogenesis permease component
MEQENPVWTREWRSRWRRPLTPISIFAYAGLLAAVAGLYFSANIAGTLSTEAQTGQRGQELLLWLARCQLVLAALFAATLSAPAISSERESGTLAMLRLTPLTMGRIVQGKFRSAALVVLLLVFVPLPMNSIAFVLGGVSVGEFAAVVLLQCSTTVLCAAGGIRLSVSARSTSTALGGSLLLAFFVVLWPFTILGNMRGEEFLVLAGFCAAVAFSLAFLLMKATAFSLENETLDVALEPDSVPILVVSPNTQSMFPPMLASPLTKEREWHDDEETLELPDSKADVPLSEADTRVILPPAEMKPRRRQKVLEETPLGKVLHFDNPILERELRARLQGLVEREPGDWGLLVGAIALLVLVVSGVGIGSSFNDPDLMQLWCILGGAVVVSLATLWAALSFSRERQSNMLPTLLMTILSPHEIARGKRDAALSAAAFYLVPMLPFFAYCLLYDFSTLGLLAFIIAFMALGASCGLVCAWLCQSMGVAVAGAFMLLAGCFGFFVRLMHEVQYQGQATGSWLLRQPFAPVLVRLVNPQTPAEISLSISLAITVIFAFAALLTLPVVRGLRPAAIEKDGVSFMTRDLSKSL